MFYPKMSPATLDQLESLLRNETWCQNYFLSMRWPSGFTCNRCGQAQSSIDEASSMACSRCGHPISTTAGTLLHGTKKSICQWLRAVWLMCRSPDTLSIKTLQNSLKIKNYQTARNWLNKLRYARTPITKKKCTGTVEIGDFRLKVKKEQSEIHLIAALEVNLKTRVTGRIRLSHCHELSANSLERVLHSCVEENSTLLLPDCHPYETLRPNQYLSIIDSTSQAQRGTPLVIDVFRTSCLNGSSTVFSLKRLKALCDDFCFQENRKLYADTLNVFETLVAGMAAPATLLPDSTPRYLETVDGNI